MIGTRAMKSVQEATAFAKAMTQHEFGRFYWDDTRREEVRRSLARAMARINLKTAVR
jgi:hypothetical protein